MLQFWEPRTLPSNEICFEGKQVLMNWNWNSKNILPSCLISLLSLALSSPEGNKLFANGTKLCSSSPGQVRGREEGFSCREEDQGWHQACQLPLQTSFWTCHGPQRSLKGLSKIPQWSLNSPSKGSQRSFWTGHGHRVPQRSLIGPSKIFLNIPWPSKVTSNGGRHLLLLGLQDLHLGVHRLDRVLSLLHLAVHPLN